MTAPVSPPATYQQWMDALAYLKERPMDSDSLQLVSQGTLSGLCSPMMVSRISDTVSVLLTGQFRDLLHQVDLALGEGDIDHLRLTVIRFRGRVNKCLFYRRLDFLAPGDREQLESGFSRQIRDFWQDLLQQMARSARQSSSPLLEEGLYLLRKIKILT